ncbi:protein nirf [Anaeramoeba ignava]|uniref:Protein nirf n=1 Tax=Anaeramoeba ignava TaxID=1746090 RepID=A0A9Q0LKZ8_ANAIG|nr:protein nirf [Anaeramoeba ignava]
MKFIQFFSFLLTLLLLLLLIFPSTKSQLEFLKLLSLPIQENQITKSCFDETKNLGYFATETQPILLVKIDLKNFERIGSIIIGDENTTNPKTMLIDTKENFLYISTLTTFVIFKIDLETFSCIGNITFPGTQYTSIQGVMDLNSHKIYYTFQNALQSKILRVDLDNWGYYDYIDIEQQGMTIKTSVIDYSKNFLYLGSATIPCFILRFSLPNLTLVDSVTFNTTNSLSNLMIDEKNQIGYLVYPNVPASVAKINLTDFSLINSTSLISTYAYIEFSYINRNASYAYFISEFGNRIISKLDLEKFEVCQYSNLTRTIILSTIWDDFNGFLYLGLETSPAEISKINLTDFSQVDSLMLAIGDNFVITSVFDSQRGLGYFGSNDVYATISRVNISTMSYIDSIHFENREDKIIGSLIDEKRGFLYFSMITNPGIIAKIDLDTFTHVDSFQFNKDENYSFSNIIDQNNGFAYFGLYTNPGVIVKIDLDTFTRVDSIQLNENEGYLFTALIDESNQNAYFTCESNPGKILKIDLDTFARVDTIELNENEGYITVSEIDPLNKFGYFVTYSKPQLIIKVDLQSFTRVDSLNFGTGSTLGVFIRIDYYRQLAFLAASSVPILYEMDLSTFTLNESIDLSLYCFNHLSTALLDTLKQFIYVTVYSAPSEIIQINTTQRAKVAYAGNVKNKTLKLVFGLGIPFVIFLIVGIVILIRFRKKERKREETLLENDPIQENELIN